MTDDAYLVLPHGPAGEFGVPPAAVGELACRETPAVRAWLDAQGVTYAVRIFVSAGQTTYPYSLIRPPRTRLRRSRVVLRPVTGAGRRSANGGSRPRA
ncbi:hypothetical protein SHIRM173S_03887 [Streptomyces hirsutus]